ncbi:hypothetical protein STENM327S_02084 [Streptomyces tendae]
MPGEKLISVSVLGAPLSGPASCQEVRRVRRRWATASVKRAAISSRTRSASSTEAQGGVDEPGHRVVQPLTQSVGLAGRQERPDGRRGGGGGRVPAGAAAGGDPAVMPDVGSALLPGRAGSTGSRR